MTYLYENLSPERFQQFCQALLTATFPNVQCLPVGQPDGGRDAFWAIRTDLTGKSDLYIFQVKFSRTPDRREDDFVEKVCQEEGPKVKTLIKRGAKAYYLLTNIKGTAHPGSGSIDKMDNALTPCLGLPSYCWWRDDLDRRIDNLANLKWSYPEIIRGSDLLQALWEGTIGEDGRRRSDAVKAYLAGQYNEDQEVKFKQVDLYNNLLDLFVDIPIKLADSDTDDLKQYPRVWHPVRHARTLRRKFAHTAVTYHYTHTSLTEMEAANFLLTRASDFPRIVVEGAPGQGKSTITQYICQVYRMRLLHRSNDLDLIKPEYKSCDVRLPFRVDIRDYASWIAGKNPFSSDANASRPGDSQSSLESFLAFQVMHASGGHEFSVSDLSAVAKASHIVIVLDGFDEVADIATREQIIRELSRAVTRLQATCPSVQVIVTSRPAAFAKSPGFPKEQWQHFSLDSMTVPQINEYAKKWMTARLLSPRDKSDFMQVLEQRLSQPHMRDLARNPMQLAILLNLIQTKGLSLPDKRTALYDSYMDLFFSREAEKSPIVREHRDLLIELHRYLAWVIQTEAEKAQSKGSVTEDRLRELLSGYLVAEGHSTTLVDDLFTGMIERVVALVSRVQGTFEFEVQPLREYFAARHLYETAPYSPPGSEKRGTKPERFDAISRDFYWLNVTRFYAGCYSRGELSSLVDGLLDLSKDKGFRHTSYPRILALMLLSDWVFTQHPVSVSRVTSMILEEPGFRILLSSTSENQKSVSVIPPERCGRSALFQAVKAILVKPSRKDEIAAVCEVLKGALTASEVRELWRSIRPAEEHINRWVKIGEELEVYDGLSVAELQSLFEEVGEGIAYICAQHGRFDAIGSSRGMFSATVEAALAGRGAALISSQPKTANEQYISNLGMALNWLIYTWVLQHSKYPGTARAAIGMHWPWAIQRKKLEDTTLVQTLGNEAILHKCERFLALHDSLYDKPQGLWRTSIEPWSELVELGVYEFGHAPVFHLIALLAGGVISKVSKGKIGRTLADPSVPLCERMRFARLKSGAVRWWSEQLDACENEIDLEFVVRTLMFWCTPKVIAELSPSLSKPLDGISDASFNQFVDFLNRVRGERIVLSDREIARLKKCSARVSAVLAARASEPYQMRILDAVFANYDGTDSTILRMCIEEVSKEKFRQILPMIRRAYNINIVAEPDFDLEEMEGVVANEILSATQDYPLGLIAAAQSVITKETGSRAAPPGEISRKDGWFTA